MNRENSYKYSENMKRRIFCLTIGSSRILEDQYIIKCIPERINLWIRKKISPCPNAQSPFMSNLLFFFFKIKSLTLSLTRLACSGFILAGAERNIRGGRKIFRVGKITSEVTWKFFLPPLKKILPSRQNSILLLEQNRQEEGGGKERERKFALIFCRDADYALFLVLFGINLGSNQVLR